MNNITPIKVEIMNSDYKFYLKKQFLLFLNEYYVCALSIDSHDKVEYLKNKYNEIIESIEHTSYNGAINIKLKDNVLNLFNKNFFESISNIKNVNLFIKIHLFLNQIERDND